MNMEEGRVEWERYWNDLRDFVLAYFRTHRPLRPTEENEKDDMKEMMMR